MSKYYLLLVIIFAFALQTRAAKHPGNEPSISLEKTNAAATVYETIMERVRTFHMNVNVDTVVNQTTRYLSMLNNQGDFPDVDYDSDAQTNWPPLAHLDRLKPMVLSYTIPASSYYGNQAVYTAIVNMLTYWYDKHPLSTNWYMQQIACPQRMGVILILLRSGAQQIPSTLETNLVNRIEEEGGRPDQPGSPGTGANKLDIATHWVYRGCLTQNDEVLSFGAEQVYYPLYLTTGEGIQQDYSYHQHGNQFYTGGYGYAYISGISAIALYTVDTPYALSTEKFDLLSKFTRVGYIPVIRGQNFNYNVLGRGLSRPGALNQSGFGTILGTMKQLDPVNETEYENAIRRLQGLEDPSYGLTPSNTHFWRSDYTLHQRPGYTVDIRMASIYTCRNENGNGENVKGYFLTDGAMDIAINGDEYIDIFPVWDWAKIPGVTSPAVSTIPKPAQWQTSGTSTFAGGVSDSIYSVTAYYLNDQEYDINTAAKKSWFAFDDEIVCLGAGINSTATQEINTTVNQCLLEGNVIAKAGNTTETLSQGSHSFNNLSWVLHNGVGYYFPSAANTVISNQSQTGTWQSINSSQSGESVTKDVLKMWFNHGTTPTSGNYSYFIVPNKNTIDEMNNYPANNIQILANTDSVQAVKHNTLNIWGIVFYQAATFTYDNVTVQADKGCIVMLKSVGSSQVTALVADPSRTQSTIKLVATLPSIEGTKELTCSLPTAPDAYAGSTFKYVIDQNTPPYVPVDYQVVYTIADSWVRDGAEANTNYGTTNTLTVKKDNSGYNREAYIKFDLNGITLPLFRDVYLSLDVERANTSISETQWEILQLADDSWAENTITWNNRPTEESLITTIPSAATGTNVLVNLTDIIADEIANGNKTLSIHIRSTERGSDGKTDAFFHSKEATDAQKRPRLLVEIPASSATVLRSILSSDKGMESNGITIYPNPVKKGEIISINIPYESDNYEISVINMTGQTVLKANNKTIDTNLLSVGVYIISIKDVTSKITNLKLLVK